jgi:hypothetical protein
MAKHVAGAVDARTLAVPDGEHAVMPALAAELGLLRTPACGRRKFLVEAGLEYDICLLQLVFRPPELLVQTTERRPAIARYEAGR